uniref:Uncharacterized protein n=1 Tax=Sinocyclocheilus anshuiensis TaxID=1608454 RepID=A0A671NZ14_9TELE
MSVLCPYSGGKDHLYHNQSRCGVCEQVLRDPVSISCGHSFCRQCINTYWDQSRPSENYDCPQCRKTSRTYPVLQTYNIIGRSRSDDSVQYYTQKAQQEKTRDLQKPVDDKLRRFKDQHKTSLKNKYERLFEGLNMRKQKYEERDPEKLLQSNREVIVKLAEVAFKQLMKGNVMFYEEDLIESGIDLTDASVYSGICTEIFKEESVIHQRKVYSFIHLSFQEFLAAFHVIHYHLCTTMKALHNAVYISYQSVEHYLFVCTFLSLFSLDDGGHFRIVPGLKKYTFDLTLDPNTAHTRLIVFEGNKKTTCVKEHQPHPDHPERFERFEQVLCVERLTGRCYWEVEWSGWSHVAVSYKGINKKEGSDSRFGLNENSWNLYCCETIYCAWHKNNNINIPPSSPLSNRVGVYVDVSAGALSFYSVSDTHTLTHLHTFNTTFTEPLYAGFGLYNDSSVSLCQI